MAGKDILEFVQSKRNIIDANSVYEKEINYAAPVPTSSEMRSVMKNMRRDLDAHSNGEMNNKLDDIERFDAKRDDAKKHILFTKQSIKALLCKKFENFVLISNFL
ncbi:hypothetical protein TNCV_3837301 [Trichonephila clavipes]|nr:hypothetical protein TNCV_3837301 [Trichonephila clavipes]